ncbi:ROK family protein [Streptomyces niveus]|uniref:ROK family protein n=1 Tax=Streptomyces niveus TaxID=193462 RepID=UPI003428C409
MTAPSTSRGPEGQPCVIALDVGGTSMKGALLDREMKPLGQLRRATPRRHGPEAVIAEIVAAVHALNEQATGYGASVRRVGVVVPGIVDEVTERAVYSANIGWENLPLGSMLQEATGLPVSLGHDVRAGGAAEFRLGAARNARDVLFMPIGTGISAALFCDGRPVRGLGYAGELGHMSVEPGGELCACGARGCLETLASAAAITTAYSARSGRGVDGAAAVAALLTHGDPDAQAVWDRAVDALTTALAAVTTCFAPELIVLGGGLAQADALLLDPLRARLMERLTFQRRPELVRSELGDEAGCLGAALMAWQAADDTTTGDDPCH